MWIVVQTLPGREALALPAIHYSRPSALGALEKAKWAFRHTGCTFNVHSLSQPQGN